MNIEVKEYKDVIIAITRLSEEYRVNCTNWRRGQCLFNALYELYPSISDVIRGTDVDPFYNDDKIPQCWNTIVAVLQGKEVQLVDRIAEALHGLDLDD
jgi:hypothetical protein